MTQAGAPARICLPLAPTCFHGNPMGAQKALHLPPLPGGWSLPRAGPPLHGHGKSCRELNSESSAQGEPLKLRSQTPQPLHLLPRPGVGAGGMPSATLNPASCSHILDATAAAPAARP